MEHDQELYNELSFDTLAHPDPAFIHQHVVDAYAAQHATEDSKPISIIFALVGLYLTLEIGFSGKQVQKMHMRLASRRKSWPRLSIPLLRGEITVADVLRVPPGQARDDMIRRWCASVWNAWAESQGEIRELTKRELDITPPMSDSRRIECEK